MAHVKTQLNNIHTAERRLKEKAQEYRTLKQLDASVDAKIKEKTNTNRGTYRLTDNFFRFWYAFGFTNFSQLEDGDVEGV